MIHVDDHSGSASNKLAYNNGMRFSTFDIDLDLHGLHCGKEFNSGWWFKGCFTANLNGKFFQVVLWIQLNLPEFAGVEQLFPITKICR